jgi:hypothetical protein
MKPQRGGTSLQICRSAGALGFRFEFYKDAVPPGLDPSEFARHALKKNLPCSKKHRDQSKKDPDVSLNDRGSFEFNRDHSEFNRDVS